VKLTLIATGFGEGEGSAVEDIPEPEVDFAPQVEPEGKRRWALPFAR